MLRSFLPRNGSSKSWSGPCGVICLAAGVAREHHGRGRGWHEIYLRAVACNECNACIAPKKDQKILEEVLVLQIISKLYQVMSIYIKLIK